MFIKYAVKKFIINFKFVVYDSWPEQLAIGLQFEEDSFSQTGLTIYHSLYRKKYEQSEKDVMCLFYTFDSILFPKNQIRRWKVYIVFDILFLITLHIFGEILSPQDHFGEVFQQQR